MIVQCPSCAAKYRVNDANVPASGGKITCPSCQHKFLVYPEQPAAPAPQPAGLSLEDKTSVALRPDLQQLVSRMQQAGRESEGGAPSPYHEDVSAATEVMSSSSVPDFADFSSAMPPEDGTVEMKNPFLGGLPGLGKRPGQDFLDSDLLEEDASDDSASTEILSNDMLEDMGFSIPGIAPASPAQPPPGPPAATPTRERERAPSAARPALPARPPTQSPAPFAPSPAPFTPSPAPFAPSPAPPSGPPARPAASGPAPAVPVGQPAPFAPPAHPPAAPPAPDLNFGAAPSGFAAAPAAPAPDAYEDSGSADTEIASLPNPAHAGPWKLKTNFGLTYEFPDNKSLKSWLSGRDELEGYELAGDGDAFPVTSWPQFQTRAQTLAMARISGTYPAAGGPAAAGAPDSVGPGAPGGLPGLPAAPMPTPGWDNIAAPAPPTGKRIESKPYRAAGGGGSRNAIWALAGLLFIIAALLAVQVFGIYDIQGAIMGKPAAEPDAPQPAQHAAVDPTPTQDPGEEPVEDDSANAPDPEIARAVDRLMEDATRDLESSRLQSASAKLNNAKLLSPERLEIYVLLEDVYKKMGRDDDAQDARKTADRLRAAADNPPEQAE